MTVLRKLCLYINMTLFSPHQGGSRFEARVFSYVVRPIFLLQFNCLRRYSLSRNLAPLTLKMTKNRTWTPLFNILQRRPRGTWSILYERNSILDAMRKRLIDFKMVKKKTSNEPIIIRKLLVWFSFARYSVVSGYNKNYLPL